MTDAAIPFPGAGAPACPPQPGLSPAPDLPALRRAMADRIDRVIESRTDVMPFRVARELMAQLVARGEAVLERDGIWLRLTIHGLQVKATGHEYAALTNWRNAARQSDRLHATGGAH